MNPSERMTILATANVVALILVFQGFAFAKEDGGLAEVEQRVRDWQSTPAEQRFSQIGWAKSFVEARRLAEKHRRPLFVFTYNGSTTRPHAIALQRC